VNVKIIEVDAERRRLSLSLKRVEDDEPVQPRADGAESVHLRPNLDLSEEVFAESPGEAVFADEFRPADEAPPPSGEEAVAAPEAAGAEAEGEASETAEAEREASETAEPDAAAGEPEPEAQEEVPAPPEPEASRAEPGQAEPEPESSREE
jgi:small subunit ribosomal protein S1